MIIDLEDWLSGDILEGYSGRSMGGKQCPAFGYESEKQAIVDMLAAISAEEDMTDREALACALKKYQIDSLGMGVVLYFPKLARDANEPTT